MERMHVSTLYCYVEESNGTHARIQGGAKYGTFSNYVNYLIAKDKGDKKSMKRSLEYAKATYAPQIRVKTKKVVKAKKAKAKKKIRAIRTVNTGVTHSTQAAA